jgi:hypothetical protein
LLTPCTATSKRPPNKPTNGVVLYDFLALDGSCTCIIEVDVCARRRGVPMPLKNHDSTLPCSDCVAGNNWVYPRWLGILIALRFLDRWIFPSHLQRMLPRNDHTRH